ncbi:hypothetical protein GQ457_04G021190 [Hibiscus cannabinus]
MSALPDVQGGLSRADNWCVMTDMEARVSPVVVLESNRYSESEMVVTHDTIGGSSVTGFKIVAQEKVSFRDKVVVLNHIGVVGSEIPKLDVPIGNDDVHFGMTDDTPTIDFSNRLHQLIDKKRPIGEITLVDLDNDYFFVWAAKEEDSPRVLMGGPLVINGCYLTVQPWSRNFSTSSDHPEKIVVWARLSGLLFQYYTKSLFRMIAGIMGRIIRIDYNTEEGKQGSFARLTVVVDLSKTPVSSIIIDGKRKILNMRACRQSVTDNTSARNDQPRQIKEHSSSRILKQREAVLIQLWTKVPESAASTGEENTKWNAILSAYFSKHSSIKRVFK